MVRLAGWQVGGWAFGYGGSVLGINAEVMGWDDRWIIRVMGGEVEVVHGTHNECLCSGLVFIVVEVKVVIYTHCFERLAKVAIYIELTPNYLQTPCHAFDGNCCEIYMDNCTGVVCSRSEE